MKSSRQDARARRHKRVRKSIQGTPQRPRLAVYRSNRHIYAQIIDDTVGHTLASASSQESEIPRSALNKDLAAIVGALLGSRAQVAGVSAVVFDRGGYKYHGRVKALAEAARKAGLEF